MGRDIHYYLERGFDQKTAEYYLSGRRRIVQVTPQDGFVLTLEFDNGEVRSLDCNDLFEGQNVFSAIHTKEAFDRVYLDEDHVVSWDIDPKVDSTVLWENKIDISPDSCYLNSVPIEPHL